MREEVAMLIEVGMLTLMLNGVLPKAFAVCACQWL